MRNLCAVFSLVLAFVPQAVSAQENAPDSVRERIEAIVREKFYDPARVKDFSIPMGVSDTFDVSVSGALSGLGVSHTARYSRTAIDYYELLDIYHFVVPNELKRLFPPQGEVAYPGIGLITKEIGGRIFVRDVYHAGSAAHAGVHEGDEILAVDGKPYQEIASFEGKIGKTVQLRLRREANAALLQIDVVVEAIRPNAMFTKSIAESIRVIEQAGYKIGYIRLWSFTSPQTLQLFREELGTGKLADVDALVLDLRCRWGGAPLDTAEIFLGGTPPVELRDRGGKRIAGNVRWRKPIVAIVDEGTRSGLEVLAYALKAKGIPLVGAHTARAVVASTPFMLPDDSLLMLAVQDVTVDGIRLEGTGVAPDIAVERNIRFENGADAQFKAALQAAADRLQGKR